MNNDTDTSPFQVLVIGYGNPHRQDDRVGHVVARHVEEWAASHGYDAVVVRRAFQLELEMVEEIAASRAVFFVDAHKAAYSNDVVVEPVRACKSDGFTTHVFAPAGLMALAGQLYARVPPATILSVPGYQFDMGEELSPRTEELAERATSRLLDELRAVLTKQGSFATIQPCEQLRRTALS